MKGMSDRKLRESLKYIKYVRQIKNYLEREDETLTEDVKNEFKARGINKYKSKTVDAELLLPEISDLNLEKVLEEFTLEELYKMGLIKVGIKEFKEKTGKSDDEIEPYLIKKPGKERLNITIKPAIPEERIKELTKIITKYPKI
ncbi:MAG: hypothetical protein QXN71_00485 [Candidatus Aenigmatarchaeota archaeon]